MLIDNDFNVEHAILIYSTNKNLPVAFLFKIILPLTLPKVVLLMPLR